MNHYKTFDRLRVIKITPDDEKRLDKLHQMVEDLTSDEVEMATVYVANLLKTRPSAKG